MDYHVFILSRIREAVDRGERTQEAVAHGIKSTAGVVTSAAVVMIAVFSIFATLSALDFKMMGVGLATAVLIDATIVRAVLLPSAMKLLGERNWYLPRWLEWLPQVNVEGAAPAAESWRLVPGTAEASAEPPVEVAPARRFQRRTDGLGVQVHRGDDRVTFVLTGELDLVSVAGFHEQLAAAERDRPAMIVVDLRELDFMDSTGLAELVRATRDARADGRRVVLVTGSAPIDRVLAVSGAGQALVETTTDPATLDG
jgi:RND superfamily putative drug exporter